MKTFNEEAKVMEESIKLNRKYTTFKEIRHKNLISNNDVVKLLEEVGFSEMEGNEEVGYLLKNENVYYGVRGQARKNERQKIRRQRKPVARFRP